MRRVPAGLAFLLLFVAAGCGPAMHVKPIGSRVDPLPPPTPAPTPGPERVLTPSLQGGWRLTGGPADYPASQLHDALGDEAERFRGTKSYASAEYGNFAQRVIQLEVFAMSSPDAAAAALAVGKPKDAKTITGDDLDEGFSAGLVALGRKGAVLVRVRWFEEKDDSLVDAAVDAMRDVLAAAVKAGFATPSLAASNPAASPTPSAAPSSTPAPSPTP